MSSDILGKIVAHKRKEVAERKLRLPLVELKGRLQNVSPPRDFRGNVFSANKNVSIIAEIKRFSPSAGPIRDDLDPVSLARVYERSGASGISVLTDERFFKGSFADLRKVRETTTLPILAKEFILDEYQIYEVRLEGADAILLIAKILGKEKISRFCRIARELDLSCIVEIHSPQEVQKILNLSPEIIIGINNRDLGKFQVDLATTGEIIRHISEGRYLVSESGIKSFQDIRKLQRMGVRAFLVGEAILRSPDPAEKIRELYSGESEGMWNNK